MNDARYLLAQFQAYATAMSPEARAFFDWLNTFRVETQSGVPSAATPPGIFSRPTRAADAIWSGPEAETADASYHMAWWQEDDALLGVLHITSKARQSHHVHCYRLPRAALALYQLAQWYRGQIQPVPGRLSQSVQLLIQAFVPDGEAGRIYTLVQMERYQYVLVSCQPDEQHDAPFLLNAVPTQFLKQEPMNDQLAGGRVNTRGHLFFEDPTLAIAWMIQHCTLSAPGYLLPLEEHIPGQIPGDEQIESRHPSLSEREKMQQYCAELEADRSKPTLTESERQERLLFLMQGVGQMQEAVPLKSIEALTEGIEHILSKLPTTPQTHLSE